MANMCKDKKKVDKDLRLAVSKLQEQVLCSSQGHVMSASNAMTSSGKRDGKLLGYEFKCIYCQIAYWQNIEDLTSKEHSILRAILGNEKK